MVTKPAQCSIQPAGQQMDYYYLPQMPQMTDFLIPLFLHKANNLFLQKKKKKVEFVCF